MTVILGWILGIVAMLILCAVSARFENQFDPQPCISDDEFCKLIREVPDSVCMQVRDILVDVSGWDREEIHPDTKLIEFEVG